MKAGMVLMQWTWSKMCMVTGSAVVAVEIHDQRQSECPVTAHKLGSGADECTGEVCSGSDYGEKELTDEQIVMGESVLETDDVMTCLVCDRAFSTVRQLMHHQTRKHHFCCSFCDSRFASATLLKQHKESEDHWSECEDFPSDNSAADRNSVQEANRLSCSEKERLL